MENQPQQTTGQTPAQTPQAAAPAAQTQAPVAQPQAPAAQATQASSAAPSPAPTPTAQPAPGCKCPMLKSAEWEKQKKVLNKSFYKTFSPRLLGIPFSFAIDVDRARRAALKKGYQIPDNPMILSSGSFFWGSVLLEISGAKADDKNVVTLNKEVYAKVTKSNPLSMKLSTAEIVKELNQIPEEIYTWYTSCPKCKEGKDVQTVLIAIPAEKQAAQTAPQPAQPTQAPAQPTQTIQQQQTPPAAQPPQTPPATPKA